MWMYPGAMHTLPNLKIPNTIRHESTQKNIPVQENKHFFLLILKYIHKWYFLGMECREKLLTKHLVLYLWELIL